MDSNPHVWTATDVQILATLAKAASSEIALRRSQTDLALALRQARTLRAVTVRSRRAVRGELEEIVAFAPLTERFRDVLHGWIEDQPSGWGRTFAVRAMITGEVNVG